APCRAARGRRAGGRTAWRRSRWARGRTGEPSCSATFPLRGALLEERADAFVEIRAPVGLDDEVLDGGDRPGRLDTTNGLLGDAKGDRGVPGDLRREGADALLERVRRHDLVDEPRGVRVLRAHELGREDERGGP